MEFYNEPIVIDSLSLKLLNFAQSSKMINDWHTSQIVSSSLLISGPVVVCFNLNLLITDAWLGIPKSSARLAWAALVIVAHPCWPESIGQLQSQTKRCGSCRLGFLHTWVLHTMQSVQPYRILRILDMFKWFT